MTDPPSKNYKNKNAKYNNYQHQSKRRHCIEIGQRGFLATCNFREKDCIRDCYNVLSQYADQLYGPEEKPVKNKAESPKEDEEIEETDISDDLQKEISAAKAVSESEKCRRFQAVDTGTKNCIFIRTTLPDPVELGQKVVKDIAETRLQKSRFILRLTPIEKVCKADVDEISKAGDSMFDKYFLGDGKTFSVVYNKRFNNDIKRDVVIKELADKILQMNPKNKVDLKNPQLSVIVEILKGKCCLSVVEGYLRYKKYNLVELASAKLENDDVKEEDKEVSPNGDSKKEIAVQENNGDVKKNGDGTNGNDDKCNLVKVENGNKKEDAEKTNDTNNKQDQEEDATENSSTLEDIVRDVPVGNKLKELLERKKSADEEPNAKKFKTESDDTKHSETTAVE